MSIWWPWRKFLGAKPATEDWPPPELEQIEEDAEPDNPLSPAAAPVHVLAGSALVRSIDGILYVERDGEAPFQRPMELVSALHVHGWAGVTSPCVAALLRQGSPVIWRGATGYPIGMSLPMHSAGVDAREAQYASMDGPRGLAIARALVTAKIVSMRGLLRRRGAGAVTDALSVLQKAARKAERAASVDRLIGHEGAATAQYFACWPHLISERAGDIAFVERTRRPPRDAVNAALSYAYAVLAGETLCAAAAAGLDPRVGVLHQRRAGRPALALDLMEPFRPIIADQAVLTGFNKGSLTPDCFETSGSAVLLNEGGRRTALRLLEQRISQPISTDGQSDAISYRQAIGLLAKGIAQTLRSEIPLNVLRRP